jgi:hypothetical protein
MSIKISKFQALYNHPTQYLITPKVTDLGEWSKECQLVTAVLRQHLHQVIHRMKQFVDGKQLDRSFQVGSWV